MSTPYITSIERFGIEKGFVQGEARGFQRGLSAERTLLQRLAKRQLGESQALLLEKIDDPDQLADIGEWLLDEQSGVAFLMRAQRLIDGEIDK